MDGSIDSSLSNVEPIPPDRKLLDFISKASVPGAMYPTCLNLVYHPVPPLIFSEIELDSSDALLFDTVV
ncbi:hypothetical protein [Lactococcus lactis]|uniref:hypothetical protein n=1 Tax=Lactococcus lactis TaxID=1358 RepID=UPI001912BF57|nr:hypothetical protein [Lactococcus lactis]WDA67260.1 hypothetical protein IL310_00405 [Lactococcus lactis]